MLFKDLGLSAPIQKAIDEMGFTEPSEIQAQALPILLGEPTDFLGLAATGTGKTAAFAIPALESVDPAIKAVQVLILCPTRELALQVAGQINLMGKHKGVRSVAIYGGSGYGDQIYGLKQGNAVVVGTPGRVVDHIERGTLKLDRVQTVVLDEADEMISMGFKEDMETILGQIPEGQARTWLFSATMSPEVRRIADNHLENPRQVQINRSQALPGTVEQIYYMTSEANKPEVLCKLIEAADDFYGIIFCQTKALVIDLHNYLKMRHYPVDCLHGDMEQVARDRAMRAFREKKTRILVATDVACRGLDVNDISHVINYSLPRELDHYVHRIGRTGRIGKSGYALNLVTGSHKGLIHRIEKMTKSRMTEGKIPTRREVGVKKVAQMLPKFENQPTYAKAAELMDNTWKDAIRDMPSEEVAARFLALMHPEWFAEQREDERPKASAMPGKARVVLPGQRPQGPRFDNGPRGDRPYGGKPRFDRPKFQKKPWGGAGTADHQERQDRRKQEFQERGAAGFGRRPFGGPRGKPPGARWARDRADTQK